MTTIRELRLKAREAGVKYITKKNKEELCNLFGLPYEPNEFFEKFCRGKFIYTKPIALVFIPADDDDDNIEFPSYYRAGETLKINRGIIKKCVKKCLPIIIKGKTFYGVEKRLIDKNRHRC